MVSKTFKYTFLYLILLLMYVPILVLIVYSFTNTTYIGEWNGFSLALYKDLFNSEETMIALGNTLILALISALVSTVLGSLGAIGAFYSKKRNRAIIENINELPVVNPEIVMALSLVVMFVFIGNYIFKAQLFSFWTLLIGHVIISAPFVYLNVKPKLQQLDPSLYEAALDLGCTPNKALNKVMIPQLIPGILSGFILAITLSFDDFIVTAFTRGSGLLSGENNIETLSTLVQAKLKKGPIPPELRALTTLIFLVVLLVVIGLTIYQYKDKNKIKRRRIHE